MKMTGHLQKMQTKLESPVRYFMPLDDHLEPMNDHIGHSISLQATGNIHCIACGRKTNKSYSQGHCFPCMKSLPQCDMCIMKPETCHYDQGTCRDAAWGDEHCMKPHHVYLANSSGIKVGISRQLPTRWIDQGASEGLAIMQVSHRRLSGLVEVIIKNHVSDRTDWRKMLKGVPDNIDLATRRDELFAACEDELAALEAEYGNDAIVKLDDSASTNIEYPVIDYPSKVSSLNFDKTPHITGVLQGIKGQYLILDSGVLNIRKFSGYEIEFEA